MDISFFNLKRNPFTDFESQSQTHRDFDEKTTGVYIRRLIRSAGTNEQIFYANAIRQIFSITKGKRTAINKICNLALRLAYQQGEKVVNGRIISECRETFSELLDADTAVRIDRRRHLRLPTRLVGAYYNNISKERGSLFITNISRSGLQIQTTRQRLFRLRDRAIITFNLDDEKGTEIREMMIIRNFHGFYTGVLFNSQPNNKAFLDYLRLRESVAKEMIA